MELSEKETGLMESLTIRLLLSGIVARNDIVEAMALIETWLWESRLLGACECHAKKTEDVVDVGFVETTE